MEHASFSNENYLESTFNDQPNMDDSNNLEFSPGVDMTDRIYDYIKKGDFKSAITILENLLKQGKKEQSVYSVLGYWYFQIGEFEKSAAMYKELINLCPENHQYAFYYAQSLFKISEFNEALIICKKLLDTSLEVEAQQLIAAIFYEKGNFFEAKKTLRATNKNDFASLVNQGWIYFKEGKHESAENKFKDAMKISGFNSELYYNLALWYYEKGEYDEAAKYVEEIIDQAYKDYPQLRVTEDQPVFESNKQKAAQILRETAIVEAINLKAAVLFVKEEYVAAKMTIKRVPAINTGGTDPVTFHNQAIFFVTENSADSMKKMNHLLRECLFPPETFQNLLFLYWKYFFYDLAQDLMSDNKSYCNKLMEKDDLEYVKTLVMQQTDPENALRKYQTLLNEYRITISNLQSKLEELPHDAPERRGIELKLSAITDKYVAVLTNQAKISWDKKLYNNVEIIFKESADICQENKQFKVNLAHSIYMQDGKHKEAIDYYKSIINSYGDDLLKCETIVLANLCVWYILDSNNGEAEKLIKKIEEAENIAKINEPETQVVHSWIVNLVIGTLYWSKGKYDFGISLITRSLSPTKEKLGTDTWYYTKRCFLSLIEKAIKKQTEIKEDLHKKIIKFLDSAYHAGKDITTLIYVEKSERHKSTVAYEARFLKKIFIKLGYTPSESN